MLQFFMRCTICIQAPFSSPEEIGNVAVQLAMLLEYDRFNSCNYDAGIVPLINASIVLQLLTTTFPSLKKLQQEEGAQVGCD